MIRVMIVEDEAVIRLGLIHSIRWDSLGFTLAAEAENGKQALELLDSISVDLLITDMRMPECDGQRLLQEIEARKLNCEIIVLSEYTDFAYMRQAIHAHVYDYLLKPVDPEQLNLLLERVKKKILNRTHSADALSGLLAAMITGDEKIADQAMETYLSEHDDSPFLLTTVLTQEGIPLPDFLEAAPYDSRILPLSKEKSFVVLYLTSKEADGHLLYTWRSWFQGQMKKAAVNYRAGMSEGKKSLVELSRALIEASLALDYAHQSKSVISYSEIAIIELKSYALPLHEKQLTELIKSGRDVRKELRQSFSQELEKSAYIHMPSARRLLTKLTFSLERCCQEAGRSINISTLLGENYIDRIHKIEWPLELSKLLNEITDKTFEALAGQETGSTEGVLRRVLFAVQTRYMEDISLISFAQEYHINYIYLSRKFKELTGETFTDCLMRIRMEKARELIEKNGFSEKEAAPLVGYTNSYYFTNSYRKYFGLEEAEHEHCMVERRGGLSNLPEEFSGLQRRWDR